jgi:hypothetical protein
MDTSVADTIVAQLGPHNWLAFIGVKQLIKMPEGIKFIYTARGKLGNGCMIQLDRGRDTYDVTFYTIRGVEYTVHEKLEDVYCDQLVELFEKKTGLYLHF